MTPQDYKNRITALGFSGAAWARFVGIDRVTHFRHTKGDRATPQVLINVLGWLESGKLKNPNKKASKSK